MSAKVHARELPFRKLALHSPGIVAVGRPARKTREPKPEGRSFPSFFCGQLQLHSRAGHEIFQLAPFATILVLIAFKIPFSDASISFEQILSEAQ